MVKTNKKFYIGSTGIAKLFKFTALEVKPDLKYGYPTTLDEAIENAKKRVEAGSEIEIVVQIVRVIRRKPVPVVVEKV